jgi:hypothetical protein
MDWIRRPLPALTGSSRQFEATMATATPTRREFAAMAGFAFSLQQYVPVGYHGGFSALAI